MDMTPSIGLKNYPRLIHHKNRRVLFQEGFSFKELSLSNSSWSRVIRIDGYYFKSVSVSRRDGVDLFVFCLDQNNTLGPVHIEC